MTNIDSKINALDQQIRAIEDRIKAKVESIAEAYEILFNQAEGSTEDMKEVFNAYFQEIKETTSKENEAIIKLYEQRSKIIEATLKNIENRTEEFGKTTTQIIRKNFEEQKKFIEENVKDEKRRNELLLGIQKEFDKKMIDQFKKTLAGENQTVFEKLNERFAEEIQLYEQGSEEAIAIQKAYNRKRAKLFLDQSQQLVSAISNLVNAGEAQLKEIEDTWGVTNQAAHDYGKAVGLNADQIRRLHDEQISWMSDNDITEQFNIGADEMFKLMGSYNQQLGRAVALTNEAKINLVSMRNVIGEEQAIKFTTNLDKFGLDVDATKDLVEGIVGDARRSGIVLSNLTQNVADNLYLAQQYTFEDGIEGLVRMAEKATAVKWNMEQTAAFAEKVNNVEGAIKTGAQLSVLGGPFAQFSNPMGMLYESLNDMEGLQDRMFAMFGSLGEWNQEKGMLDISAFDKQRIRAAASAMGLNYADVINNVNQQARRNVVMDQIKGYGLDENTTELIANTAQIDRETGRAYVNYEGKKIFANEIGGRSDKDKILDYLEKQANSSDENLRDIAHNTLGAKEMVEAVEKEFVTDRADFFRSIGISKEGVAETHEKIMYAKYGLDKVNQVLSVILGVVQAIATVSAFRGMFGGGAGRGIGTGGTGGITSGKATGVGFGKVGTFSNGKTLIGQYGSAQSARRAITTSNITNKGMGASMIGLLGGTMLNSWSENERAKGNVEKADKLEEAGGAINGLSMGAMLGGQFGGLPGMLIGGAVGLIGGLVTSHNKQAKRETEAMREYNIEREKERIDEDIEDAKYEFYTKTGIMLKGDYSSTQIRRWMNGRHIFGSSDYNALTSGGDSDIIQQIPLYLEKGGVLTEGSSHAEGGMDVVDNKTGKVVAQVEAEEGVVDKDTMAIFGSTENLVNYAMKGINQTNETVHAIHNNPATEVIAKNNSTNNSLNVSGSADVNVGGLIQVMMANGQMYEIEKDPGAMRQLGDNVMKHIMLANNQIFNKSEFYRKW